MICYENRACCILYRFVKAQPCGCYLLPANVCPIVPLTILAAGSTCDFVDISNDTLCLDLSKCIEKLEQNKNKYVGILFVHTYGVEFNVSSFATKLKEIQHNLSFIDDRCLCIPSLIDDVVLSPNVDLVLYSTGYAKYAELGYGGFGSYKEGFLMQNVSEMPYLEKDVERIEKAYKYAFAKRTLLGDVSTIHWIDISLMKPEQIKDYRERLIEKRAHAESQKKEINAIYASLLPPDIQLAEKYQNWRFNLLVPNSEQILKKLFSENLFASRHYQPSIYLFQKKADCINANNLFHSVINLFNDHYINKKQAELICKIINKNLL